MIGVIIIRAAACSIESIDISNFSPRPVENTDGIIMPDEGVYDWKY